MRFRQIGNAWSERENKRKREDGRGERGVVFFFFFFWGVHWPWKMLVGFFTALEESLWGLFSLPPQCPSLNQMTGVQAAISADDYPAEVSLSKTQSPFPASDACSLGGSDLWPHRVGGRRQKIFPMEINMAQQYYLLMEENKYKTAAASNYF